MYDCLFANDELICKLFSFLDQEEPLNALLAGHFGKIVATLLSRRPFETFKVIETKGIVPRLLKHLNTYSVLELLLKVSVEYHLCSAHVTPPTPCSFCWHYSCFVFCKYHAVPSDARTSLRLARAMSVQVVSEVVESDSSEQEVAWLYRIGLVEQLIEKLSKTQDSEVMILQQLPCRKVSGTCHNALYGLSAVDSICVIIFTLICKQGVCISICFLGRVFNL